MGELRLERSGYFTGIGHSFDRVDVVLSGAVSDTDPLRQNQRNFTNPFIIGTTAVPGAVGSDLLNLNLSSPSQTNPTGVNAVAPNIAALVPGTYTAYPSAAAAKAGIGASYPLSQFQYLLMQQKTEALTGNFTVHLTEDDHVLGFVNFQYMHGDAYTQFLPRIDAVTVPVDAPYNPTTGSVSGVQFGVPQDPKRYYDTTDKFRVTAGLRGEFNFAAHDWKWETAFTHSQDELEQLQTNVIYGPNVAPAILGGYNSGPGS